MTSTPTVHRGEKIHLPSLAVGVDIIENITFEDCDLIGPAVLFLRNGSSLNGIIGNNDLDVMFWQIPPDRPRFTGAIVLDNCQLIRCRLNRIGFAVTEGMFETYVRAFGG